jgi:molecular chaperone DnaK (HSP70)
MCIGMPMQVTATEQGSGVQAQVEVKPSWGLTDGEIETMLRDSLSHAGADDREVFLGVRPRGAGINERRPTRD